MLHSFRKNPVFWMGLIVFLMQILFFPVRIKGEDESGGSQKTFSVQADRVSYDPNQRVSVWQFSVIGDLLAIPMGNAMALPVLCAVEDGWEIVSFAAENEMQVTASQMDCERKIRILVDGIIPSNYTESSLVLFTLTMSKAEKILENDTDSLELQLLAHDDAYLYYVGKNQGIVKKPYAILPFPQKDHETEGDMDITESNTMDSWVTETKEPEETTYAPDWSTETVCETEAIRDDPGEEPTFHYVGCQETSIRDGQYAVRFLFAGKDAGAPVLYMKGKNPLTVAYSQESVIEEYRVQGMRQHVSGYENGWSTCTFRGLLQDETYVFLVFTENICLQVIYRDGFCQVCKVEGY